MRDFDEDPSDDDIERFSSDTARCPECGEEVWDQADVCPECGAAMTDGPGSRSTIERHFTQKWIIVVVVILILAMLAWMF